MSGISSGSRNISSALGSTLSIKNATFVSLEFTAKKGVKYSVRPLVRAKIFATQMVAGSQNDLSFTPLPNSLVNSEAPF